MSPILNRGRGLRLEVMAADSSLNLDRNLLLNLQPLESKITIPIKIKTLRGPPLSIASELAPVIAS